MEESLIFIKSFPYSQPPPLTPHFNCAPSTNTYTNHKYLKYIEVIAIGYIVTRLVDYAILIYIWPSQLFSYITRYCVAF